MTSVTSLNFIPLILGSVFCLVRKESDKNTKIIQIISWVLSFAIIVSQKCRAQNPLAYTIFPRTVFLSIYVFGFISTFHALYLPHRLSSSVFLLIQLAIFALYLICQNDNIYYICCGFFLNSVLTWFTIPKDSNEYNSRAFQLQILTDLCLIFGFFIFLQYNHSLTALSDLRPLPQKIPSVVNKSAQFLAFLSALFGRSGISGYDFWHSFAGGLVLIGIILKAVPGHKCAPPTTYIFTHQGVFASALFLLIRMEQYYATHEYYTFILLFISSTGLILFNIMSMFSRNIYRIVNFLNLGAGCLVVFLCCLCCSDAAKYAFIAYFFIQGSLFLVTANIAKIMSGESDVMKMGAIMKLAPVTFALFLLISLCSVFVLCRGIILAPLLYLWTNCHSIYTTSIYVFFVITHCLCLVRYAFLVFLGRNRSAEQVFAYVKEVRWELSAPIVLCLLSAFMHAMNVFSRSAASLKGGAHAILNKSFMESNLSRSIVDSSKNDDYFYLALCLIGIVLLCVYLGVKCIKARPIMPSKILFRGVKFPVRVQKTNLYIIRLAKLSESKVWHFVEAFCKRSNLFFFEKLYSDNILHLVSFLLIATITVLGTLFWVLT